MRNACVLLVVLLSLLSFAAAVDEVKVVSPPALKAMFGADGLGMSSFFSPCSFFFSVKPMLVLFLLLHFR